MANIGTLMAHLGVDTSDLKRAEKDLKSSTGAMERGLNSLKNTAMGVFAGFGIVEVIKELYQTGMEVQRLDYSFRAINGSVGAAQQELDYVREITNKLGQEFYSVADAYRSFSAAAKTSNLSLQQQHDIFTSVIEASTALGLSTDQTKGTLYALEQMLSKGVVSMEELRRQLGDRLPGAFAMAAGAMGMTQQSFTKLVESGQVLSDDLLPKLAKALHERYAKGAIDASDNAIAAWKRSITAFKDFKNEVGEAGVMDALTSGLKASTEAMKAMTKFLGENRDAVVSLINTISTATKIFAGYIVVAYGPAVLAAIGAWIALKYKAVAATVQFHTQVAAGNAVMLSSAQATAMKTAANVQELASVEALAIARVQQSASEINSLRSKLALITAEQNQIQTLIVEGRATADVSMLQQRYVVTTQEAAIVQAQLSTAVANNSRAQIIAAGATARHAEAIVVADAAAKKATFSFLTLGNAVNMIFAGWIGYQIGKYLYDEFEIVRKAGVNLVTSLDQSWTYIKYGALIAFEGIKSGWDTIIYEMQLKFKEWIVDLGNLMAAMPFGDKIGSAIINVGNSLNISSVAVDNHKEKINQLVSEMDKEIVVTREIADEMYKEAGVYKKVAKVVGDTADVVNDLNKGNKNNVDTTEKVTKAAKDHANALQRVVDTYLPLEKEIRDANEAELLLKEALGGSASNADRLKEALDNLTVSSKQARLAQDGLTESVMETGMSYDVMQSDFQQGQDVLRAEIINTDELYKSDTDETAKYIQDRWDEAYNGIQDILAEWIKTGEISFDSFLSMFKNMLAEMVAAWLMNMGRMAIGNLLSGSGGILGAIGSFIGGGSSGGGGGGFGGGLGSLGTLYSGYQYLTGGSSLLPTSASGVSVGGPVGGGVGYAGTVVGSAAYEAIAAEIAAQAAQEAAITGMYGGAYEGVVGGIAAEEGGSAGLGGVSGGIGGAAVASVFAIGISLWAAQMMKEDVPPMSELMNQMGIGPDAFAYAMGDTFKQGMNPVFGGLEAFMMDAESSILTRSKRLGLGIRETADSINDINLQMYDNQKKMWIDLGGEFKSFEILATTMGRSTAASMIEAKSGVVGLSEELINITDAQKTSLDIAIESLQNMGVEGEELTIIFDEVSNIISGVSKDTSKLKSELKGLGLASDQVGVVIEQLGLDVLGIEGSFTSASSGLRNFVNTVGTLDYGLTDLENALGDVHNAVRTAADGMVRIAEDTVYNINDLLAGVGDGGNDYPSGENYGSNSNDSTTRKISVDVNVTASKELDAQIVKIADNNRVQADLRGMKGRPMVF